MKELMNMERTILILFLCEILDKNNHALNLIGEITLSLHRDLSGHTITTTRAYNPPQEETYTVKEQ
jgi:hypothetical protein